jgi:hypothetical protein
VRDEGIAPAENGLGWFFTPNQGLGLGDGIGFAQQLGAMQGDVLFNPLTFLLAGRLIEQMLLGHIEHTAGTAGRIIDGGVPYGDGNFQQLDHQPDNLTRREVVTGCLGVRL